MRGSLIITLLILSTIFSAVIVKASKAGVGVLNVTPTYKAIKLQSGENAIELKLTISDYNSWKDVYKVELLAESGEKKTAGFLFLHYQDKDSFDEINLFKEIEGNGYLLTDLCDVKRSLVEETVDDRCTINVTFVFKPIPYCTRLQVAAYDREGERATMDIYYAYQDLRNEEIIVPFWSGEPIRISPDLPNVFALSTSLTLVTFLMIRRRKYVEE